MNTSKPLILLVEDNLSLNKLIEANLNMESYDVHSLHSAAEAREFLLSWKKDLRELFLVVDYSLEDEQAPEFIKSLEKLSKLPPFIVISGYSNPEIIVKAMKLGAMDYLVKTPDFAGKLPLTLKNCIAEVQNKTA